MQSRLRPICTVAMIAVLVLAACSPQGPSLPSDPVEAVKLIADKQKDIKSQHFDLSLNLTLKAEGLPEDDPTAAFLKDFKASFTGAGDVDNATQNFQLKGTADLGILTAFLANGADEVALEVRKIGNTTHTKIADQDWTESTLDANTAESAGNSLNPEQLAEILKKAAKAEKLGDENVSGVDSHHYKVTLDSEELIAQVAALAAAQGSPADEAQLSQVRELLKDSEILVELWAGKADLLVRKETVTINLDLRNIPDAPPDMRLQIGVSLTLTNSKLNEPVTIEAPK